MLATIFNQKYKLLVLSLTLFLGTLIYAHTWSSPFYLDDASSIVNNPAIRNIANLPAIWNFWPARFITYLSVALNYHFSQLNVFSYHLFNLIVHLISSLLVSWLLLLTFSTPCMQQEKITKQAKLLALFAGLIFLTHPLQTEGVTYIIQRATSLATLFYLLALSLYVKFRLLQQQEATPLAVRLFYCLSLIVAVMAMFTKEMTITLPFMLLLYEICFLKGKDKLAWKHLFPFLATLLVIPLTMFLTKSVDFIGMKMVSEDPANISSLSYLFTQLRVMVTYLRLLFIPLHQNLDYAYPISSSLLHLPTLASFILLALILTIAFKLFSKHRFISFSIFWFFLALLPESSIIPIQDVIFEHRLYLPMAGFSFFTVAAIYYLLRNKPLKLMVIALLILTSCYAMLTYRRNLIWQDELTLWNDVVHKSPQKARPYYNRGNVYKDQGNMQQAIFDYSKTIEINPKDAAAYNNRGNAYYQQGNFIQAISDYSQAIIINPKDAVVYFNRGNAYNNQGNMQQAFSVYTKAIAINPNFAHPYNNRGNLYIDQGNMQQAFSDFNKAIAINSNYAEAYNNRGNLYYQQGSFIQAISDYNKAITINSSYAEAYSNRGSAYYMIKEYAKAWIDVYNAERLGCMFNPGLLNALKKASERDK